MRTVSLRALWCVVASFPAGPAHAQSDLVLHELAQEYWDARMQRHPTEATALGDYRFNDRLMDVSERARAHWRATLERLRQKAEAIDATDLNDEDRLTHALLKRTLEDELLRLECDLHLLPLEPLEGPHIRFPLILVSQPFRNAGDYYDYARRLAAFSDHIQDHMGNMRKGLARGWTGPRAAVEKTIPQIKAHMAFDPRESAFYGPLENLEQVPEADRSAVRERVTEAIKSGVLPAYERLWHFVRNEYLPRCTTTVGIGALPGGGEAYKKLIRIHTTTGMTAKEIHELGLSEVERIRRQMAEVQEQAGFDGSLDDFLAQMRTDPRYRFDSATALLNAAAETLERSKPRMKRLFTRLPEADCIIKAIESFRAAAGPVAYYNPAPLDRSRPGYYYVNTFAPDQRLRFTLEALTYHEAVPGHHLQVALHQERRDLPDFRRHAGFTAFVEGWALYAEKLGYEIGGYQTPQDRFGQLTFEMWRACRLVVDTGIHAKGWSRDRAIEYLQTNTSLARHDIEAEVDRYFAWPGQALAYKIGELRILELRERAEKALGQRFDLRRFHDALLAAGPVPLDVLETRMWAWIAERSQS